MSDTHGQFGLTYLEPAVDKVKDVASWTYTHVQEVTDVLESPLLVTTLSGTFTIAGGSWDWDVTVYRFLSVVQVTGDVTRGTTDFTGVGANGEVNANVAQISGVPLPVSPVALASGLVGTARASDFRAEAYSGDLLITLTRTQPLGAITVGESVNFSGVYLTDGAL